MTSIKKYKDNCFNKYDNYEHIYCKNCHHSGYFKRNHEAICSWCGALIYPSKRSEFKASIKKLLIKNKGEK